MSIRRWEPFSELMSLRSAMDRMFEERFGLPGDWRGTGSLAVDVYQTDKDVIVEASIAGVKPEDIDISITGDTLTIKGESKQEEKIERENYFFNERRYGTFSRTITLPMPVESDKADAKFENGVLKLTLPKAEQAKAKKITVKS
ncbi:MAG: Hsp20/alpha crystallin family protein [Dehalococcoidales bacterium]|nr:Hsp20/alpha crystallin family protein [Dehalococcoidales bacterium]